MVMSDGDCQLGALAAAGCSCCWRCIVDTDCACECFLATVVVTSHGVSFDHHLKEVYFYGVALATVLYSPLKRSEQNNERIPFVM